MSTIQFAGLTTGIDTDSIVTKLMTLARQPETLLKQQSEDNQAKKTVISTLVAKLSTLQNTVEAFNDPSLPFFSQKTASSSQTSVVTPTVIGSQPASGTYTINVTQLATVAMVFNSAALYTAADSQAQAATAASSSGVNASGQTVDPAQSLNSQNANLATSVSGSGSFSINGVEFAWNDSQSIQDILAEINSAGLGVSASFDSATQKLSIRSQASGSAAQVTLAETSGNWLAAMNLTAGTTQGADAVQTDTSAVLSSGNAHMDRTVTAGTFTINGVLLSVDPNSDTLQSVITRINNSGANVTAALDYASGRVTLTQKSTGSANQIVLGASGDTSNILYALKLSNNQPPVGGAGDTYSGNDAQVSFNNGAVQTFTQNTVDNLIPGLRLNFAGQGTSLVTVGADVDGMATSIADFVSQYNDVMNYINSTTQQETVDDPSTAGERIQGAFAADPEMLETKAAFTRIISQVVPGLPNTLNQLSQIGITTSSDNFGEDATLTLDETKLRSALTGDTAGVEAIFNTATTGVMTSLKSRIDSLTDFVSGAFTLESKAFDTETTRINQMVDDMEIRFAAQEAAMRQQFANMETLVANLKAQGDRLSQILGQTTSSSSSSSSS